MSKAGNIWEIKKKILGGNKKKTQANAIIDPETGKLVVSKQKIKEVSLKYCKDTFTNNQPEKEYENEIELKKAEVEKIVNEKEGYLNIGKETFDFIISKFKTSKKKT